MGAKAPVALFLVAALAVTVPGPGSAAEAVIARSAPAEGATVVGKRPRIVVDFAVPVDPATLVAVLDGTDVTNVARVGAERLEYVPVLPLAPGSHELTVFARSAAGADLEGAVAFASRHTGLFQEAGSENEIGVTYEYAARKPEGQAAAPDSRLEASLTSDSILAEGPWKLTARAGLAYLLLDPETPTGEGVEPYPPEEEPYLTDYLFSAAYDTPQAGFAAAVGNLQIDFSPRTVSGLARRGTSVGARWRALEAGTFMVQGGNSVEFDDLAGIGGTEDHIWGANAGLKLFGGGATVRGIFAKGGESGSSPGISDPVAKEGHVAGAVLETDFLQGRLRTAFEADFSEYDPDTSDEFEARSDEAYSIWAGGSVGTFGYEGGWERRGRDFVPIGNLQLEPDREIWKGGATANLASWQLSLGLSRTRDNVEDDPGFPRVTLWRGTADASSSALTWLPFGLSYQRDDQSSDCEPEGSRPLDLTTDTWSAWAKPTWGPASVALQFSRSAQDDGNADGPDTTTTTYGVTPALARRRLTVAPGYTFTRAETDPGASTDTRVASLDLRSRFLGERLAFDLAGSWTANEADDGSVDTRSVDANARLAYTFTFLPRSGAKATLAVKGVYSRQEDKLVPGDGAEDDYAIYLAVSAALPFTF